MFLILDNTEDEKIVFSFWLNDKFVQRVFKFETKNNNLAFYLEKLLSELAISPIDLKSVGVVVGGEKFTAARLATTFANTVSFGLNIPVIRVEKDFDQISAFKLLSAAAVGKYIVPVYSGEARVG